MKPLVWFRRSEEMEDEYAALAKGFPERFTTHMMGIPQDSLVIGRYSVLPFYKEVEEELGFINSRLVNSLSQHLYLANIQSWYDDLWRYTPRTWLEWSHLPQSSFVVKGRTNSRKFQWNRQMFCPTRGDVPRVAASLMDDSLIRDQGLCVREYVSLRKLDEGINGLPISNEWRVFFIGTKMVAADFYWSNFEEVKPYEWEDIPEQAHELLKTVGRIVAHKTVFYVVDIAETAAGDWVVIELNDGQMSGLSCIDPHTFYHNLFRLEEML